MIRPTIRPLALVGAALALTLVLAACASATGTVGTATSAPTAAPASSAPTTAPTSAPTTAPTTAASVAPTEDSGGTTGTAVSIKDFSFNPAASTAKVGQEVTWTNGGSAPHTVTFDTGGVDSGTLSAGSTFKHTFDAAGKFTYHCSIHSAMQATITVSP